MLGLWWCSVIALLVATAVLGRRSRCMSKPHSYAAHIKHSVVLRFQKTDTFHKKARPCVHRAVVTGQGDWRIQDGARRDRFPLRRCSSSWSHHRSCQLTSRKCGEHLGHTSLACTTKEKPRRSRGRSMRRSAATLAQAISCSNVRVLFLRDEFFSDLSCPKCLHPFFPFSFHDSSSHA